MTGARCSANRKGDGQRCGQWAVPGGNVCRYHGGNARQVKAAGKRRREQEEARQVAALFGVPRDVEPGQALLDLVHWTAGEVEFWRGKVRDQASRDEASLTYGVTKEEIGTDKGQPHDVETREAKPHIYYVMLYSSQDRLTQYATAALRAGVEERRVRLAEQQGDLVALAIRRILGALGLTPEQEALVTVVVPRELRAISS